MTERLRDPFQAKEEKFHRLHCMCLPRQRMHLSAFIAATVAIGLPVSVSSSERESLQPHPPNWLIGVVARAQMVEGFVFCLKLSYYCLPHRI